MQSQVLCQVIGFQDLGQGNSNCKLHQGGGIDETPRVAIIATIWWVLVRYQVLF